MRIETFGFVLAAGLATYLPRLLPIVALKYKEVPEWVQKWMSFLPVTIFASLVCSDIFFWKDTVVLAPWENLKLLPALVTAVAAYRSKNMILSVLVGIASITLMVWAFA